MRIWLRERFLFWTSARNHRHKTVDPSVHAVLSHFSHVWLFAASWTVAGQAPLSMKFYNARILGCVAISSSRGSSQPRDQTQSLCLLLWQVSSLPLVSPKKSQDTGVKSNFPLTTARLVSFSQPTQSSWCFCLRHLPLAITPTKMRICQFLNFHYE